MKGLLKPVGWGKEKEGKKGVSVLEGGEGGEEGIGGYAVYGLLYQLAHNKNISGFHGSHQVFWVGPNSRQKRSCRYMGRFASHCASNRW
ncbi:hypothetical protein PoB_003507400 [Plakobranchus ocellatus]|uniref:Uncharacterized protein n=1 Tax=Plakobranchus ocellatus TaxID=259542 RepID=A0AAV4ALE5_9GAST|nr:hypothetical protein PoB_003507400 [Plakobranchus ocellatus]